MIELKDKPTETSFRVPYTSCPLCGSKDIPLRRQESCAKRSLYDKRLPHEMNWHECQECNHFFTEGTWTKEACDILFSRVHPEQDVGFDVEHQRYVSAEIIDKVIRHLPPDYEDRTWLDIGFGSGNLLFTAAEYGFKPVGTDLRPATVEKMQSIGIDARCEDITELKLEHPAMVISMADCLEHMRDPKQALEAARRLLRDDGALFLSMPNAGSPIWQFLDSQNQNPYWGELEHYHNFTRERLNALLMETGFQPVNYGVSVRYRACMEIIANAA